MAKDGKVIDMATRTESGPWFTRLQKNSDGTPHPTVANAMIIAANDPRLKRRLAYNAFTSQPLLMAPPPPAEDDGAELPGPYPRAWMGEDVALVQGYMQRVWNPKFAKGTVEDAMLAVASSNQFHPVQDWLTSLSWDGKPRLDLWLVNAFDVENNAYHRAIAAKFLIAAVRRIFHPGCKFDHMLVLEGSQGIGKSKALRSLFGEQWFSDSIPPDLSNRDAAMALLGIWCLEFAEIEHLIRLEVETIKAFISRAVDRYRPPYAKSYVDRPRQGVLAGTTNSDDYLRDSTGNRRVWPARCRCVSVDWIEVNRDHLWAEAIHREKSGESIWLDDEEISSEASSEQSERLSEDMWTDAIHGWLHGKVEVRIPDILNGALDIPKERQGKQQEIRVSRILKKLKWTRDQKWSGGKNTKIWFAPDYIPK